MVTSALLGLLNFHIDDSTFESVLEHLGDGVRAASRYLEDAKGHEDLLEAIVDEECNFIEVILERL